MKLKFSPQSLVAVLAINVSFIMGSASAEEYCGLEVAPEDRCSDYERHKDYTYNASIEWKIAERAGYTADKRGWLDRPFKSPYMKGVKIRSLRDTDIEHIVAAAEGHDSGLCAQPKETRTAFARDLGNLTLALPSTNRYEKVDKDPAEWMPEKNVRWYVRTWMGVKEKYGLTIDEAERDALKAVLGDKCPQDKEVE